MTQKTEIQTRKQVAAEKAASSPEEKSGDETLQSTTDAPLPGAAPETAVVVAVVAPPAAPPARSLAGRYRVREGYTVAHGKLDENGRHAYAKGGDVVELSHDEARSTILLTKDQKNPDGTPNGPAIETEDAYTKRVAAEKAHQEFMQSLADMNNLPT